LRDVQQRSVPILRLMIQPSHIKHTQKLPRKFYAHKNNLLHLLSFSGTWVSRLLTLPSVSCSKHIDLARRTLALKWKERKRKRQRQRMFGYEKFGWVHLKTRGCAKGTPPITARLIFVFFNMLYRFAFVDFTSIENATAVLINPKNHHLNGRTLVVEYAGADAVRRGAPKSAKPVDRPEHKGRGGRRPPRADNPRYRTDRPPKQAEEQPEAVETAATVEPRQNKPWDGKDRSTKGDNVDGVRHKGPKTRPKPGAALALAKRESVAIVPSEGKKITF
jgi:hypothetical protein